MKTTNAMVVGLALVLLAGCGGQQATPPAELERATRATKAVEKSIGDAEPAIRVVEDLTGGLSAESAGAIERFADRVADKLDTAKKVTGPAGAIPGPQQPWVVGLGGLLAALAGVAKAVRESAKRRRTRKALSAVVRAVDAADAGDVKSRVAARANERGEFADIDDEIREAKAG